ncbi:MAG: FkbM family methyltransferase [Clostridia bacterium]|nr:FkbM family methyltransferase [Clostridia bacterium]
MLKNKDLWTYLQKSDKKILMYGMGNGADKILSVCERYGIEISDFFASDGFVRGHLFHGKRVLSYSEAKEKYGSENMIILLSFASSLPDVMENIYRISSKCELYAPDVPVCGDNLFNYEFYTENKEKFDQTEALLCDERSKEVFRSVVSYKLSGDIGYLKDSCSDFSEVYRLLGAERFERIADLGAYNGDTLREITPFAPSLIEAIAFEPDRRNHKKLSEYAETVEEFRITPLKLAAWSDKATLCFDGSGNRNSSLISGAQMSVTKQPKIVEAEADSLDNILDGKEIDYIKYDVEGSDSEAIIGSLKTIEKHRPALLISLYHRSEDLFDLPLMIHERFPDYQFFMRRRQYIPAWDTVLIAVKK